MLTIAILLYALIIAIAATGISTVLIEPGKPLRFVKIWLENNYAYQTKDAAQAEEQQPTFGKMDRTNPQASIPPPAKLVKSTSFWVFEMLIACTVCFSGQMAFWLYGFTHISSPERAIFFALILVLYLLSALVAKSKLLCGFYFGINFAAIVYLLGWKSAIHVPITVAITIYFAAVAETIYNRFLASR